MQRDVYDDGYMMYQEWTYEETKILFKMLKSMQKLGIK
jgi:hypothetical protein